MENSNNGGTSSKTNNDDSSSDDDSVTTIAKNVKKSKHSHSSCANDDITRHQNNLLITNNANVNLGTVYRTDRFLSHGGIPSESLAAFQQEDSSIASQSHSDPIRSQRMENRLRLFSSRTKGDRNRYILSVMQPEQDQIASTNSVFYRILYNLQRTVPVLYILQRNILIATFVRRNRVCDKPFVDN